MSDDVFGQDIKLDAAGQALVAANGDLLLTAGAETGVQDVRLRLATPLSELFYDKGFGALLHEWVKEENTAANRNAFEAEAERRVQADPRVNPGSAGCRVTSWDDRGIIARVSWEFMGEDHPFNLVVGLDAGKGDMVIKDVDPRTGF